MTRSAMLGFVGGVACLQACATLPAEPALALAAASAVFGTLLFATRRAPPAGRAAVALLCGAACGFFWAATLAQAALAPQLARADEGRDLRVVGVIDSLPYRFEQGVRFNFTVEHADGNAFALPPRVALSWYAGRERGAPAAPEVAPGERWALTLRLQRPHGNVNPGGFDYEVWLLEQGLRATGYVRPSHANHRLARFVPGVANLVERCRAGLRARILTSLAGQPYAGVIVALVVGDQRAIDQCM